MNLFFSRKKSAFLILLCIIWPLSAQINIKGKVVDGSSSPIQGAAVHLLNANKIEFTNASGEFNITANSPPAGEKKVGIYWNRFFNSDIAGRVSGDIFLDAVYNVKGVRKRGFRVPLSTAHGGTPLTGLFQGQTGLFITKTQLDGKSQYGKFISWGSPSIPNANSHFPRETTERVLAKPAASDVLVVSALGKNQVRMDISDLGKDVGSVKLSDVSQKTYYGRPQLVFKHEGQDAYIVLPEKPHPAKPWIWRSTFWDDDPELDMLMVSKGYYLVYVHVKGLLGNDVGVKRWETFYEYAVNYLGFWHKVVLSGWSRAGLQIFHFAAKNPEKVSVIFADAATCDVKYWPGTGDKNLQKQYGMSKEELEKYDENPVDPKILEPMAKANIAIIHETREKDPMVPEKHVDVMAERYTDLGGIYKVIKRPGSKHTAHAAKPEEIEPFITEHNPLPEK